MKAVTFSFDDGVTQDKRLIEILNKYGLKATFNLNSALLGTNGELNRNAHIVRHDKNPADKVAEIYRGHEVAVHTLVHPNLTELSDEGVIWQVEEDRKLLESLVGYDVRCIRFARTITSSDSFDIPDNLLRYNPTVYYIEKDKLFSLGEKFLNLKADKPQVLYVWGHSYEMDAEYISWREFEEFCKMISGKDDIFYGTNGQIFLQ